MSESKNHQSYATNSVSAINNKKANENSEAAFGNLVKTPEQIIRRGIQEGGDFI
jgi:hypothetical protein